MREALSQQDLDEARTGTLVEDCDDDIWTKQDDGLWSTSAYDSSYQDWSSDRLTDEYRVYFVSEPWKPQTDMPVLTGPQPPTNLRLQALQAENNWLGEGNDDTLFNVGVERGWFTDRFYEDWASGDVH